MTPKTEKKAEAKDAGQAPQAKGQGDRVLLIELSCKDKKCSPCTYPNCQRFAKEMGKKKAPFSVKVTEIEKGKEVRSLLSK